MLSGKIEPAGGENGQIWGFIQTVGRGGHHTLPLQQFSWCLPLAAVAVGGDGTGVAASGWTMHCSTLNTGQDKKDIYIYTVDIDRSSKYCCDVNCMGRLLKYLFACKNQAPSTSDHKTPSAQIGSNLCDEILLKWRGYISRKLNRSRYLWPSGEQETSVEFIPALPSPNPVHQSSSRIHTHWCH